MTLAPKVWRLPRLALTLAATTTLAASALAAAAPASAAAHPAAANAVAGYAWVDHNAVEDYYDFDSANTHAGSVTVSKVSDGVSEVEFANMASIANDADVQVTPYSNDFYCTAAGWRSDDASLEVVVDCFALDGTLTDAEYNVIVTHPTSPPNGVFDYALDNKPTSAGTLGTNQYNSSHKKNSVKRLGTGKYQVLFGGPASKGTQGIVHVTPVGAQPGNCEVAGWTGSAKGELVNIDCFGPNPGNAPQNRPFIVAYATSSSLMGLSNQFVANAFANGKSDFYQPAVQFNSKRGARVAIVRYDAGEYEVAPSGSGGNTSKWGGNVQVSAVGSRDQLCIIDGWSSNPITPSLTIECFSKAGIRVDTPFTVEWVVP